jgi:deoxyribodipyrimidine photo-lyase
MTIMHQNQQKNKPFQHALVWLRRDLRLQDHPALNQAMQDAQKISFAFVFDTTILKSLPKDDRRLTFIWQSLLDIQSELNQMVEKYHAAPQNIQVICLHGEPVAEIPKLAEALKVDVVYSNEDYEPSAIKRDTSIQSKLKYQNIEFKQYRDHVLVPHDQIWTMQEKPFTVFSPYKRAVLKYLQDHPYCLDVVKIEPKELALQLVGYQMQHQLLLESGLDFKMIDLAKDPMNIIGFQMQDLVMTAGIKGAQKLWLDFQQRLDNYHQTRDFPSIKGVSYLSTHLRFGTVGIRELGEYTYAKLPDDVKEKTGASTWFSELLWHDFFSYILFHFPHVATGKSFNPIYQNLRWRDDSDFFKAWCDGQTGFTIVDAGMRQLNQTGYMHNRLRMICASFLVKDLGIDWRWGEAYFAEKLLDFDFASNNGGWQWAASTGCDPQPYFRIFNPHLQGAKFDEDGKFIRRYIPELESLAAIDPIYLHDLAAVPPMILSEAGIVLGEHYPKPIVDHRVEKEKTLKKFEAAAKAGKAM